MRIWSVVRDRIGLLPRLLCLMIALAGALSGPVSRAAAPKIGMNLMSLAYFSLQLPFLDRLKTADPWRIAGVAGSPPAPLDARGNPAAGMPAGTRLETGVSVATAVAGPSRFILTYQGKADFEMATVRVISMKAGRIVFATGAPNQVYMPLRFTITDPANPPRDIHVVLEEQAPLLAAGQVFNPRFVEVTRQWSVIRTMDWQMTNSVRPAPWEGRAQPADAIWTRDGVPLEILVRLANEADVDLWLNIPASADDAWVRNALTLVDGQLDRKHRIYVEYANEVWNFGLLPSHYALDQGDKLWGKDVNHDGKIDPDDKAEHFGPGWVTYYGYRAAQVAAIARATIGNADRHRLRTVIATQTAAVGGEQSIFDGVGRAKLGTVGSLFTDYAVTTYFGGEFETTGADAEKVIGWARSGEAGMAAAFNQLRGGSGGLSGNQSLGWLARTLAQQAKIAADNKLTLVAYEGGTHMTALQYPEAAKAEIIAFYTRLQNDPRAGELYAEMVRTFAAANGDLLCVYGDVSNSGLWGYFGVLESIYQPTSPRFQALAEAAQRSKAAGVTAR